MYLKLLLLITSFNYDVAGDPTGATDSTQAFKDAATYSRNAYKAYDTSTGRSGFSETIRIPPGKYKISDEITNWSPVVNIIGEDAVIIQTDTNKKTFNFTDGWQIKITGVQFVGGANSVYLTNANVDYTTITLRDCKFKDTSSYAVYMPNYLSCKAVIDNPMWVMCNAALYSNCDTTTIRDAYVQGFGGDNCFVNMHGVMHIDDSILVPTTSFPHQFWIKNYGHLFCTSVRFSGEASGGLPVLKHVGVLGKVYPYMGSKVVFQFCQLSAGSAKYAGAAVVTLDNGLPQLLKFDSCNYLVEIPLVYDTGSLAGILADSTVKKNMLSIVYEDCVSWPIMASGRVSDKLVPYFKVK